ncbi:hypothetical protein GP486_007561 [Trichoglossum hirsutum]|uniref:Mid2 domain-containing protein n=1 Tax=Trichoglossum hirsutum TaxID=265104 RepID=A0A9P8IBI2_9PEZI|nr:hypothetical protein GP486_007561 [Trichoglossum hirsutum]
MQLLVWLAVFSALTAAQQLEQDLFVQNMLGEADVDPPAQATAKYASSSASAPTITLIPPRPLLTLFSAKYKRDGNNNNNVNTNTISAKTGSSNGGLSTSDKIAIGVGVPGGVFGFVSAYLAWREYSKRKRKAEKALEATTQHPRPGGFGATMSSYGMGSYPQYSANPISERGARELPT